MGKTKTAYEKWRQCNPVRYAYYNLKHNAKRRNKPFDLTFEQFEKFAIEVNLLKNNKVRRKGYHIDRIDPNKGYTIDNIQKLTVKQNCRKGATTDKVLIYNYTTKDAYYYCSKPVPKINCPF